METGSPARIKENKRTSDSESMNWLNCQDLSSKPISEPALNKHRSKVKTTNEPKIHKIVIGKLPRNFKRPGIPKNDRLQYLKLAKLQQVSDSTQSSDSCQHPFTNVATSIQCTDKALMLGIFIFLAIGVAVLSVFRYTKHKITDIP
jgi:hypothetical protein